MVKKIQISEDALASEAFFKSIPAEAVSRLETYVYQREYEPRQVIFFPDDRCDHVYWVRSGRVKITQVSEKGREISFRHLVKGDMFGEECLVNLPRRRYYAEAISPTVLTLIRSNDFVRVVREEPQLSLAVTRYACQRAVEVEQMLSDFVFSEVRDRIVSRLWQLYCREQKSKDDSLSLTHQELANLVGAARETVTGELHRLRDEGVITLNNRRISVINPEFLRQMSGNK